MRPKLEKLKSMLWECPYKGEIEERAEAIEGAAESGKKVNDCVNSILLLHGSC